MITFFRTSDCPGCNAVQDALEDLGIAHKVVLVPQEGAPEESMPHGIRPPVLADDEKIIQGIKNIIAYLEEMKEFKELWYKYQSDVCYCD